MGLNDLKLINWDEASEIGLIAKINAEYLHPRGLAITRNPKTGKSDGLLISDDGVFEYSSEIYDTVPTDDTVKKYVDRAYADGSNDNSK